MIQRQHILHCAKLHFKWQSRKLFCDELKFQVSFGKHGSGVLQTKEKSDHLTCYCALEHMELAELLLYCTSVVYVDEEVSEF